MKKFILLLIPTIFSCTSKEARIKEDIIPEHEVLYLVLTKDDNRYCEYLSERLNEKVKLTNNANIRQYDSLTSAHVKLLDSISGAIKANTSMIFFDDESDYSRAAKNFVSRTKVYQEAVEKLADDPNLRKRLNLVLNMNDVKSELNTIADNNEGNIIKVNTTYIKYLDYYFKGFTANQCIAFLSSKKRSILEMEMEYVLLQE